MSGPKQKSSLLDGFVVGEHMSDHHGVRCCPAIKEETDERYIVKIVSIPPSSTQLDALLLSGAYSSKEAAMEYFREQAQEIDAEIKLLGSLAKVEGFLPHLGSQTMELPTGFRVLMLNRYERTLARQLTDQPLTHLAAVNLGLDMCAALTAARRAGYLYVDLKPENIVRTEGKGYCISDLGFLPLSSLKYASLPEKYRSSYTAPEITDDFAALNDKLDIYALGLVLYQVYNNGQLPFTGAAPAEPLPSPLYADYEIAQIILKACSPNPEERWADPAQMGQELVNYMQRNSINDNPIVPPPVELPEINEEETEEFLTEDENEAELAQLLSMIPDEAPPIDDPGDVTDNATSPKDDTASESTGLADDGLTNEVSHMLAQADELLAMELPEPVVAPDAIDVPIPPPIVTIPDSPAEEEPRTPAAENIPQEPEEEPASIERQLDEEPEEEEEEEIPSPKKRRILPLLGFAALLCLLIATIWGGTHHYNNVYLQTIDQLEVKGIANQITVTIVSDIDESLLTVVCTDNYGNALRSGVTNHAATFSNLNPSTLYKIHLEISGKHKLKGPTTGSYTTAAQTQIHNLSAITGATDGSVKLSFAVSGPEPDSWTLEYFDGKTTETMDFQGHNVDLEGLAIGSEYSFRLSTASDLYLTGELEISHRASPLILAQNLRLQSYRDGKMSIAWEAPEGHDSIKWTVLCKNDRGFEKTLTLDAPGVEFADLDTTCSYVVTVTAEGMSQSQTLPIGPNPINVTGYSSKTLSPWLVELSWDYTGPAPKNGWELRCTSGSETITMNCAENKIQLPFAPGEYRLFEVIPLDDAPCFGLTFSHTAAETGASPCVGADVSISMHSVIAGNDLTAAKTVFAPGEGACLLLGPKGNYPRYLISVSFVVTSARHTLISETTISCPWASIWSGNQGKLQIPQMPSDLGSYTLAVYMNNQFVAEINFEIQPVESTG
ncbi:MAG: protein kinase [Oscillospiraceae bacterium]|nr:protein kinase [Oscillospiraceae bacterium]